MKIKKNAIIKLRCTHYEKKLNIIKAKKAGISLSEFYRKSANEKSIKERLTPEQIDLYRMLMKYHNHFKSIGNLFRNKDSNFYKKVNETADEIKNHLQNFK